ncbi:MAG: hypothetical protein LJE62_16815, partial [Silicimonas sp.]|nr:hypothetical protein [Silicimonas sp.]
GEGGEGGELMVSAGYGAADVLTDLGLIEGHLRAGMELYRAGMGDMAATHMKHPGDELYAELAGHLEEYGHPGFADELTLLSEAVAEGAPVPDAEAAFEHLLARIGEARRATGATPQEQLEALRQMVLVAAEEYEIGIKDGAIIKMHEYQDAWGFVRAARAEASELAGSNSDKVRAAAEAVLASLGGTDVAFTGIAPEGNVTGDASALYGAAARIEIAALRLK